MGPINICMTDNCLRISTFYCCLDLIETSSCRFLTLEYSPGIRLDPENLEQYFCAPVGGVVGSALAASKAPALDVTCEALLQRADISSFPSVPQELPLTLFVHFFDIFVEQQIQCAEMPKSGFKLCGDCLWRMIVSDPNRICLWCLGLDYNSRPVSNVSPCTPRPSASRK